MGKLVVLEGIDGSGKSTQFKMLCERLNSEGRDFMRLSFPRYDEPSSALIKMYLAGGFGENPGDVNPYAASTFYTADRYASYLRDWRRYYEDGGVVLTDRYTTSNAIHQGAKLPPEARKRFFEWLFEYEYSLVQLPAPDLVAYFDIEASDAAVRIRNRAAAGEARGAAGDTRATPTTAATPRGIDIHERDTAYLDMCVHSVRQVASLYGWYAVPCFIDGRERTEGELHDELYGAVMGVLA